MAIQPFRFLDLPPEIREKIYIQISTSPTPYVLLNAPDAHASFPLNLLLTNVQIYHELRPLYFTVNPVSIILLRSNESWSYFLSPSWQDNRREIRKLRLSIMRWGTKDFFIKTLTPMLEDCILNGKLRDLEVRTRSIWMKETSPRSGKPGLLGAMNWTPLRGLLNDPYLERGVLMTGQPSTNENSDQTDDLAVEFSLGMEPFRDVEWMYDFEEGTWQEISEDNRGA